MAANQPAWTSPVYSDARAAWTGSLAERPNIPMRIEAAAYRGKPVYFELIGPWTRPSRMEPYHETARERVFLVIFIVLFLAVLVGSAILARRNLRLARGDRRGAFRVAAFVFVAWTVAWFFGAHHVPSFLRSLSSWSSWSGGAVVPASRGFSTLPLNLMCVGAGLPRWFPGVACWGVALGIH